MIPVTVTVAICTIPGREALLQRAVESVTRQTRVPDAVIIHADVDRVGAADARNAALAQVDTTHVAFLDDDDELLPHHLALLTGVAELTGSDVVYPWFVADPPSSDTLRCIGPDRKIGSPFGLEFSDVMRGQLETGNNFLHLTALIRVAMLRSVGGFVALGPRGSQEDAGAYQALAAAGASFAHVPERTWIWHRGAQGTAGRGRKRGP